MNSVSEFRNRLFSSSAALLIVSCFCLAAASAQTSQPAKTESKSKLADTKSPILGEGAYRYQWRGDFFQLPEKTSWGNTHGNIAVDGKGRVYVNTDTERAVMVFAPDGKFLKAWGKDLARGLHGMTLVQEGKEEFLYLAHTSRGEILKTTLDGKVLWRLGCPDLPDLYKKKQEYRPTAVAVTRSGDIFVADGYGKSVIHHFDKNKKLIKTFGGWGGEYGKFRVPHGLYIDNHPEKPELVVADRENSRLQRFDLAGNHLGIVTGAFRRPCSVHGHGDRIVVADLAGRITILDRKARKVTQLGDQPDERMRAQNGLPAKYWKPGEFIAPHYACFGPKGEVYVMDWVALGRVTRLDPVAPAKPKTR